jgi:type II secretory pathway pseudopilin PulG
MALPNRRSQDGFTLVEVLIAALLVTTVVVNVAALGAIAVRTTTTARRQTSTSLLATQKMEQLLALTWGSAGAAPAVPVSDLTSDLSRDPPSNAGSGLSPSPAGALDHNLSGYVDYLDEAGVWVGTGPEPPPRSVFVRRWSIDPIPMDPDNLLVLQVFVTTVEASQRQSAGHRVRQPGDAYLVDVKARVGQ